VLARITGADASAIEGLIVLVLVLEIVLEPTDSRTRKSTRKRTMGYD